MGKTIKRLCNLKISEVSLVDQGANPSAHVVFFKRKETEEMTEALEKALKKADARAEFFKKMSGEQKAAYDAMPPEEQAQLEAMNAEEQAEKLKGCVKKSADSAAAEIAKRDAELKEAKDAVAKRDEEIAKRDAEIAKLKEKTADADLRIRVQKEFPRSAGTEDEKVAKLKAIEGLQDEAVKKSLIDTMKQAEEFAKKASSTLGDGGDKGGATPTEEIQSLAKAKAAKEGITYEQAFAKVYDSPEGREIRKRKA